MARFFFIRPGLSHHLWHNTNLEMAPNAVHCARPDATFMRQIRGFSGASRASTPNHIGGREPEK